MRGQTDNLAGLPFSPTPDTKERTRFEHNGIARCKFISEGRRSIAILRDLRAAPMQVSGSSKTWRLSDRKSGRYERPDLALAATLLSSGQRRGRAVPAFYRRVDTCDVRRQYLVGDERSVDEESGPQYRLDHAAAPLRAVTQANCAATRSSDLARLLQFLSRPPRDAY